jgi:hypothetical protein
MTKNHVKQPPQFKRYENLPNLAIRKFSWKWAGIIMGVVILTALTTRFFDAVHYSKLLFKSTTDQQTQQQASSKDLLTILRYVPGNLSCQNLQTNFAQQQCQAHNNGLSN